MAEISQKMLLRGVLVGILNSYKNENNPDNLKIKQDIETLSKFKEKEYIAKILIKEITDIKSTFANICAIFLIEAIDNESFEKQALEVLKDNTVSDDKKFFIVSLLKQKGIDFDLNELTNYIQNSQELAQDSIKDFLTNAIDDPEVQVDLLDFYVNVPSSEKKLFLDNLLKDYDGDDLANALSIIAQSDLDNEELELITQGLITSASPYAIEGLETILQVYKPNKAEEKNIKKAIKEIKFAHPNFKNTLLINNSKIYKCFIGFVDGRANFPLIASRKRDDGLIDTMLITIDINLGITSCMGFGKISENNFNEIVSRLFSDSITVDINPIALKGLSEFYSNKNLKTHTRLPFEYNVWKKILTDVRELNYDISEFLNKKLETINLKEKKVLTLARAKIMETWYYSYRQNEYADDIIHKIENEHATKIEDVNRIVSEGIEKNFLHNHQYLTELQNKLLIQSYVAHNANLKMTSAITYSLCFKNPYLKLFITSIIDKSIYYYLSNRLFEYEAKKKKNFKQITKTNFSKKELISLMEQLENKWNQKKES